MDAVQAGGYVGRALRAGELLGPAGLDPEVSKEGGELPLASFPFLAAGPAHQRTPS